MEEKVRSEIMVPIKDRSQRRGAKASLRHSLIGKGHAMIYEEQADDAPSYAEHRIFIHYRVLPEYECDEVMDVIYEAAYECALELRKRLSNRVCELCIGNKMHETVYNEHARKLGYQEFGSIYHLGTCTKKCNIDNPRVGNLFVRKFTMDTEEILHQLVRNDQVRNT